MGGEGVGQGNSASWKLERLERKRTFCSQGENTQGPEPKGRKESASIPRELDGARLTARLSDQPGHLLPLFSLPNNGGFWGPSALPLPRR